MKIPYLRHFGLTEAPYSTSPNPRFLYVSPTHKEALEKTKWTIGERQGLAFCFGPVGTGKTTIARELAQQLQDEPEVLYVFLTNPNYPTPNQLLRSINQEFGVPETSKNFLDLMNIFKNFVTDQSLTHQKTLVLLIDEAQTLTPKQLELLRQLMNFESNDQKFLQVVLFAQEEFRQRLRHATYRNLVNRAAMSSVLQPLTPEETADMLRYRWMVGGGKAFPFTEEALTEIHAYSQGIPRTQVILANNVLLATYLDEKDIIDGEAIRQVVADRGLPDAPIVVAPPQTDERLGAARAATAGRRRA